MKNIRQLRLADQIRDVISQCFQANLMQDPRLDKVVITAVKLSADLQIATVYYRVFDLSLKESALIGLKHASGFLKQKIADNIKMRRVPQLRFFYDESIERAEKIEFLLQKIKQEEKQTNTNNN